MTDNIEVKQLKLQIGQLLLENSKLRYQVNNLMGEMKNSINDPEKYNEKENILRLETLNNEQANQIEELQYKVELLQEQLQFEKLSIQQQQGLIINSPSHPNYQQQINNMHEELKDKLKQSFIKHDQLNKIILEQQQKITYLEMDKQVLLAQVQEENCQGRLIYEKQYNNKNESHQECQKRLNDKTDEIQKLKQELATKLQEIQALDYENKKLKSQTKQVAIPTTFQELQLGIQTSQVYQSKNKG